MKLFIVICVSTVAIRDHFGENNGDILDDQPVTDAIEDSVISGKDRHLTEINHEGKNDSLILTDLDLVEKEQQNRIRDQKKETEKDQLFSNNEEKKGDISDVQPIAHDTDDSAISGNYRHLTEINHDAQNDSLIITDLDQAEKELQGRIREGIKKTEKDEMFLNNEVSKRDHNTGFNLSSARCFHPKEKNIMGVNKMWDFEGGWNTAHDQKCYDKYGMGFKIYVYTTDCCGCMHYMCDYGTRRNQHNQYIHYMHWVLAGISASCCQDCHGSIYPPNQVMKIDFLEDKCSTEVTSVCKYNEEFSHYTGLIAKTYKSNKCCDGESGTSVEGTVKLDPITCSQKQCVLGKPSFWLESPVFPGECNCCVFNESLVTEGAVVTVKPGLNATCCDGKLVFDYTVVLPSNCSDPEVVHRPLAFSIDNTGYVGSSAVGIRNLTNSLITGVEERGYKIPVWVLTTFNDVNEQIEDNTELVIETTDNELMRDALNDITYSGGGDAAERVMQGLLLTLNTIPKHGLILVFLHNPSKNLELEDELIALRDEKMAKIHFVFTPTYHGRMVCPPSYPTSSPSSEGCFDPSWEVFKKLSEGKMYDMAKINRTAFLEEILLEIRDDCESLTLEGYFKPKRVP